MKYLLLTHEVQLPRHQSPQEQGIQHGEVVAHQHHPAFTRHIGHALHVNSADRPEQAAQRNPAKLVG